MTTMLTLVLAELERAAEDEGHCFLLRDDLHARMRARVDAAIRAAVRDDLIVVRGSAHVAELPTERIYLRHLDEAEQRLATGVVEMLRRAR